VYEKTGASTYTLRDNLTGPQGIQGIQGVQGIQGNPGTTLWSGITDKPSTFPPSAHNHDDRYYTETESDARYVRTVNGTGPEGLGNVGVSVGSDSGQIGNAYDIEATTPTLVSGGASDAFNTDSLDAAWTKLSCRERAVSVFGGNTTDGSVDLTTRTKGVVFQPKRANDTSTYMGLRRAWSGLADGESLIVSLSMPAPPVSGQKYSAYFAIHINTSITSYDSGTVREFVIDNTGAGTVGYATVPGAFTNSVTIGHVVYSSRQYMLISRVGANYYYRHSFDGTNWRVLGSLTSITPSYLWLSIASHSNTQTWSPCYTVHWMRQEASASLDLWPG